MASTGLEAWREVCTACGRAWPLSAGRWECSCGGLLDLLGPLAGWPTSGPPGSRVSPPDGSPVSPRAGSPVSPLAGSPVSPLARYGASLPPGSASADLGLAVTRTAEMRSGVFVKADHEQPTGSFKDRGASVMIGVAGRIGVQSVVVDSSGNAGKAAAAHAARAGIACTVYVPAGTSPAKVTAIASYGAEVVEVAGDRQAAADAAQRDVASTGRWYASHVYQPLFHHGVKTLAFELFEQVEGLSCGTVFVPAGNGTLVLGLWLGFNELVALGRMPRPPAIVAVQAEACAPLAGGPSRGAAAAGRATAAGRASAAGRATAATGIAIPAPPRATQIRAAVLASGGRVVTVGEEAIAGARSWLAQAGFEVEPTGAVAWAALEVGRRSAGPAVAVLTGR